MSRLLAASAVLVLLAGCAGNPSQSVDALNAASQRFQSVKENPDVLRSAPKDVIRASESLARAERLSSYWGSEDDVVHYAYLSQRYSEIAEQHSALVINEERIAKLELDRQRLQLALREAKLLGVQEQSSWLEEQLVSLTRNDGGRGLVITLGDMLFDAGRSELKTSANRTALKLVQFLQLNPRRVVRIEGYTDNRGDAAENLKLSTERAQAVADVLIDLGIDASRVAVQGHGEDFPVAENASSQGRAQNRRVEVVFSDEQGRLDAPR